MQPVYSIQAYQKVNYVQLLMQKHQQVLMTIALMRVLPKAIVLTTKPRIDAYVLLTPKWDLVVRTIALEKTRISASI